jgi:plastocyanin
MLSRLSSRASLIIALFAIVALTVVISACGGDDDSGSVPDPMTRTFYMEAVEPKGSATVDKETFPEESLPEGGGYGLKEPDDSGKWEVETYTWAPDQLIVNQGDTVNLEIIGINGARHEGTIEGHVDSFVVERGKLTSVSFVAENPGVFKYICKSHQPAMTGELVVLAR